MHVVHVIRDLDVSSGGPSRSVPALAAHLARDPRIDRVSLVYQDRRKPTSVDSADSHAVNLLPVPKRYGYLHLGQRIRELSSKHRVDMLHVHGLWSPTLHGAAATARRLQVPYVVSPRGMLSPSCLSSKSLKKRIAWSSYQRSDLHSATFVHATSELEREDCSRMRASDSIVVVPNACDPPPSSLSAMPDDFPIVPGMPFAVSIARIDRVKGFEELVEAWAQVSVDAWRLVIAGPGDPEYIRRLRRKISELNATDRIHLTRGLAESEKWSVLNNAALFISSSHSENFGMAIAESLASGTPVVTTHGTPWQVVTKARCGWWVPVGVAGLKRGIEEAVHMDCDQRRAAGERGRELIAEHYSWPKIAAKMAECYQTHRSLVT